MGTPPQRQTVIIDTGSSITAFPCTGCDHCGSNPTTGEQYHLDDDFDTDASSTYEEKVCTAGTREENGKLTGKVPCDLGSCTKVKFDGNTIGEYCHLAVSYAEGSTWSAAEGNDVVYPAGPHEEALMTREERLDAGVGAGMGSLGQNDAAGQEFDWMNFQLKFGCQSKVTGLFRTQLEDGIMGMDNRKGSFWLQLHEHYKQNGYAPPAEEEKQVAFDPAQFSLCYDRQPLSMDLRPGVGSGTLTLGGTDPLLHKSDMVFAENITPIGGWFAVRISAMFLRTLGGTLYEPPQGQMEYLRVNAEEAALNGNSSTNKGVIIDSGTTDTYLPKGLNAAFEQAWKAALGEDAKYHNSLQELTPEQIESLPTILLVLKGHPSNEGNAAGMALSHPPMLESKEPTPVSNSDVVVAIPPSHYMEESHTEPGKYTSRVYFNEKFGGQPILGSNFLMGHEVNFDVGRGRVGFAESHCDYDQYVQERDARQQELLQQQGEIDQRVAQEEKEEVMNENDGSAISENNVGDDLAASGWSRRS